MDAIDIAEQTRGPSDAAGAATGTADSPSFMRPGAIGGLVLKNRLVRAATSETRADGAAIDALVKLYSDLARGGDGLIITGHIYVEPRGQYEPRLGLDRVDRIAALKRVTDAYLSPPPDTCGQALT